MNTRLVATYDRGKASTARCAPCPLDTCPVCSALPQDAHSEVLRLAGRTTVNVGEPLPTAGAGGLNVLAAGVARIEISVGDGRRQIAGFRYPGDVLPAGTADAGVPRLRAIAVSACILCTVPHMVFESVGKRFPILAQRRLNIAEAEARRIASHLLVVGRMTAAERILTFLSEAAARIGTPLNGANGPIAVPLPMTREDIADYLGLNVETVSRNLSSLKGEGLIKLPKPSELILVEPDTLRERLPQMT